MNILTKEIYQLMQMVGLYTSKEQIAEIKKSDCASAEYIAELVSNWKPYPNFNIDKEKVDSAFENYHLHDELITNGKLSSLRSLFDLHDARILSIFKDESNVNIKIDSLGAYGNISEINFIDCISEFDKEWENAMIIYVELYEQTNSIKFCMLIYDSKKQIQEIDFIAKDVILK